VHPERRARGQPARDAARAVPRQSRRSIPLGGGSVKRYERRAGPVPRDPRRPGPIPRDPRRPTRAWFRAIRVGPTRIWFRAIHVGPLSALVEAPLTTRFAHTLPGRALARTQARILLICVGGRRIGRTATDPTLAHALDASRPRGSAASTIVWEKQQPRHPTGWSAQPSAGAPTHSRERRRVRGSERRDAAPRGGRLTDDKQPGHMATRPAAISRDVRRKPSLAIQGLHHRLRVRDDGLHLHHQDGLGPRVPCEDVDRPSLAPLRERDLHHGLPATCVEQLDHRLDQSGMRAVQEAIETFASPPKANVEVRLEGCGHPRHGAHRHTVQPASLDQRHRPSRNARRRCEILLPPTPSQPERPVRQTEPNRIHRLIVNRLAHRRVDRASPSGHRVPDDVPPVSCPHAHDPPGSAR